jgi:drug/metabolite transporter (DMT)-like permease
VASTALDAARGDEMAVTVVTAALSGAAPAGAPGAEERGSNARGIAAMLIGMFCFVASDTLIKIVGRDLAVGQIMFLRGIFATALLGVVVTASGGFGLLGQALRRPLVIVRTLSEAAATTCFFAGLVRLPFADAAAIGQFTPLAVTAAAALFLAEPVGWRRWLATGVGLIGVLLIIRPGTGAFNPAALFILACVGFVVVRDLTTRQIGQAVPATLLVLLSVAAVALTGGVMGVLSLPEVAARMRIAPLEVWGAASGWHIGAMALSAVGVSAGYYCTIIAMRSGEISVVAPFRYSVMLYALFWSFVVFKEVPDRTTWIGVAIVIGAGLYTVYREHVRRREAAARLRAEEV